MNRIVSTAILVVLLGALVLPAAPAEGKAVHEQFRGRTAFADFSHQEGCILTTVFVSAGQPSRATTDGSAFVAITEEDTCTGETLRFAFGQGDVELTIDRRLQTATLTGTLDAEITDFVTGETSTAPVTLDLTWSATGELSREKRHEQFDTEMCKAIFSFKGQARDATATGSILLAGENVIAGESGFGQLGAQSSSSLSINCPEPV
jgi:hypothetical protein